MKIKIVKNGPYLVTGDIPLMEMVIETSYTGNSYVKTKDIACEGSYALCRCGKSKNAPFCDGSHEHTSFDGTLTAPYNVVEGQVDRYEGENVILEDAPMLCAYARFCHAGDEDIWGLMNNPTGKDDEVLAIKMACDCPSGRLVMRDKRTNQIIEPKFSPSIVILQDPSEKCSGPIWVRGGIPIVDETGKMFECRNRVTLCRCGHSTNKPFCNGTHMDVNYKDNQE